jgi:L-rhamnose 1-dehydrogenase
VCRITPQLWAKTHDANLTGAFNTIHAAATQMSTQSPPGGSIIGISSISALVGGAQYVSLPSFPLPSHHLPS